MRGFVARCRSREACRRRWSTRLVLQMTIIWALVVFLKKTTTHEVSAVFRHVRFLQASFLLGWDSRSFIKAFKGLPNWKTKISSTFAVHNTLHYVTLNTYSNTNMSNPLHFTPSLRRSAADGRRAGWGRGWRRPARGRGDAEREGAGRDPAEPGGAQRGQTRPDRHRKTQAFLKSRLWRQQLEILSQDTRSATMRFLWICHHHAAAGEDGERGGEPEHYCWWEEESGVGGVGVSGGRLIPKKKKKNGVLSLLICEKCHHNPIEGSVKHLLCGDKRGGARGGMWGGNN